MPTVAIVGVGSVALALGERLNRGGVDLRFGVRDPASAASKMTGPLVGVPALLPGAAAADAEIIFLAVPAAAAVAAARSADNLGGKTLVDCTNPLRWDGGPIWAPPPEGSVAQALAAAFPDTSVLKGFNHFGAEIQRNPKLLSGPADAFIAGDDPRAKSAVMDLAARMGFRARCGAVAKWRASRKPRRTVDPSGIRWRHGPQLQSSDRGTGVTRGRRIATAAMASRAVRDTRVRSTNGRVL